MAKHYLIRPTEELLESQRWTGTTWIPDDGAPGLSFSGRALNGPPMAYYGECNCFTEDDCPQKIAMNHTAERWHCSNGCAIESHEKTEARRIVEQQAAKKAEAVQARNTLLHKRALERGLRIQVYDGRPWVSWEILQAWLDEQVVAK